MATSPLRIEIVPNTCRHMSFRGWIPLFNSPPTDDGRTRTLTTFPDTLFGCVSNHTPSSLPLKESRYRRDGSLHALTRSPFSMSASPLSQTTEPLNFDAAVGRVNEIAEALAKGTAKSKGRATIELRKLCGHHRIVPEIYKLEGVGKNQDYSFPYRVSQVTSIWRGRYLDEEVALKVLTVRDDSSMQRMKSRFCKEVVLMKQIDHKNILPFYGVSTAISDFCLVSPWYKNGNVTDYLAKNPNVNRYELLLGAIDGLRFLHENRMVHGALRPSHVLIDDSGNVRLSTGGRSSIFPMPNTSIALHQQSRLAPGIESDPYMAPEIQWAEGDKVDGSLITKESDVYEMSMVIYEVLSGERPYSDCNNSNIVPKVQAGETPKRPAYRINDLMWGLLEECWRRDPGERPPTLELHNTLSNLTYNPQAPSGADRQPTDKELPEKLRLQATSLKFLFDKSRSRQFYVRFRYGNKGHKTQPTKPAGGPGEHTWIPPDSWVIETNKQYHGQVISLEVFRKKVFRRDKLYATGDFSLFGNVNREVSVGLVSPGGAKAAVLNVILTKM